MEILWAVIWFAALGLVLGLILAIASKVFAVKVDERVEQICDILPGANCGGCGYSGCAALAQAIVDGKAEPTACNAAEDSVVGQVAAIMGVKAGDRVRMRAQVMCSGTHDLAGKKYVYDGAKDCIAAARLGGGDKICPNGCIGLGTCADVCKFDAIHVENGVAAVDYKKCTGCGMCVNSCPKNVIKLIPYDAKHWVGCRSVDKGPIVRKYCDVGCIGCRLCEKNCETGAIKIDGFIASIDYDKCNGCDKCVEVCPRKIIWSSTAQENGLIIKRM
ncbi:MAG: RnfABCDGE type electron transport complex subunit B [Ruminococcaceae bacterium]|nr:RnfABCDGE type electron transport complex subunit B [Oscillospiraceae bacterium]